MKKSKNRKIKHEKKMRNKRQKASRVSPAVARLTVYRRLQVMTREAFCRARPKSNTDPSLKDTPVKTEVFGNFDKFFWKSWVFMPLALPFGISVSKAQRRCVSGISWWIYSLRHTSRGLSCICLWNTSINAKCRTVEVHQCFFWAFLRSTYESSVFAEIIW